ncbi:MAG: hypothetical protein AAFX54_17850 [Pseudomonadota bacterium]
MRVKEDWQEPRDGKKRNDGSVKYGKSKSVNLPFSIAAKVEAEAKAKGISQSRLIVEAIAEKYGIDLE